MALLPQSRRFLQGLLQLSYEKEISKAAATDGDWTVGLHRSKEEENQEADRTNRGRVAEFGGLRGRRTRG